MSLLHVRQETLDRLRPHEVVWDPYYHQRGDRPFHEVAFSIGCLKCMDIVEPYQPDRVLRQFGYEMGRDTVQQKYTKKNKSKGKSYHRDNGMQDFVNMISGEEQDAGKEDEELVNEPEEAPPSLEDGSR
ncbi:hypothetical protein AAC387_Pa09g0984 [Persea americana]